MLSWLRRRRLPETAPELRPPVARRLAGDAAGNRIHALLDAIGLPWREPRGRLAERHGTGRHPAYTQTVIALPTDPPLVPGLLWPLDTAVWPDAPPDLPPISFSSACWVSPDPEENIRTAVAALSAALGPVEIVASSGLRRAEWRDGAAAITLTTWREILPPPREPNPAHLREPRLAQACHIAIETGFRRSLSKRERDWLAHAVPLAENPSRPAPTLEALLRRPAAEAMLEFARLPDPAMAPLLDQISRAPATEALIFCQGQFCLVPAERIENFCVERLLPAKGSGGATLLARLSPARPGWLPPVLTLAGDPCPDGLTQLGERLAAEFARPCEISPYANDV
ncbi:hypothetical protein BKE38_10585 [Pseudoroseomonas deserti]|uniref:Uncharacterized protein n=1 Tax=Teichococcus deserti TaxID=1817963 RepID=A0A1V2H2Y7_9PROT|nr:hypothetical protein [Pseudoroseomonas deserti]ONG54266.1 hypothetical protein BKE38_10585 [Pseudoroseomonas deserti]